MIALVDYGAGNLTSVKNALDFLGFPCFISNDPAQINKASRVIFPGVGAAASSMEVLQQTGLGEAVRQVVASGKPVLGICVGCQIILESSEEDGGVSCLGILPGRAVRFQEEPGVKIPHMGWNAVDVRRSHPVLAGLPLGTHFYFVHSYYPQVDGSLQIASTTYGNQAFASVIGRNNLIATQFHAEKSGEAGLILLRNFCNWDGTC